MQIMYSQNNKVKTWDIKPATHWGIPITVRQEKDSGVMSVSYAAGGVNKDATTLDIIYAMKHAWSEAEQLIKDNA